MVGVNHGEIYQYQEDENCGEVYDRAALYHGYDEERGGDDDNYKDEDEADEEEEYFEEARAGVTVAPPAEGRRSWAEPTPRPTARRRSPCWASPGPSAPRTAPRQAQRGVRQ